MPRPISIEDVKTRHQKLFTQAAIDGPHTRTRDPQAFDGLVDSIDLLLKDITQLTGEVDSPADYEWLASAAIQWHALLSSTLRVHRPLAVKAPPSSFATYPVPQSSVLQHREVLDRVDRYAELMAFQRIAETHRASSPDEVQRDWCHAESAVAFEVLDGTLNFAGRIGADYYEHLEHQWVKYVKCAGAYRRWLGKSPHADRNYYDACGQLRLLLINHEMKGNPTEFSRVQAYLEEHYLSSDGLLRWEDPCVRDGLLSRKANRLYGTSGRTDEKKNWADAGTYLHAYYNHIIAAARDKDPSATAEVISALSTEDPIVSDRIINCFEAAVAVYFLDADLVAAAWEKGGNRETTF